MGKKRPLTLSEIAMKENGNPGKLINKEKYSIQELILPDYKAMGIDATNITLMVNNAMKDLAKRWARLEAINHVFMGLSGST
jgi:hypothetical protein